MDLLFFCSVLCLLCLCARLFERALWSPAGKGLTSWLSFVVSIVSLSLSHCYPGSDVVLDCIDSWSLHPYLLWAAVCSKAVVLLLLTFCLLLLPLSESVIVICFVVRYFMSIPILQSSWWGRESWLLCLVCVLGVSWWLSCSSSRCHGVVCGFWLWYFLIILTYYFFSSLDYYRIHHHKLFPHLLQVIFKAEIDLAI